MAGERKPGGSIEKLMSITRAEFETGVERLTDRPPLSDGAGGYILAGADDEERAVTCSFEELGEVVLGGLMKLPRARVRLDLAALPRGARAAFVARFDRTFQRGGG